jgi:replication factor A1
MKESGKRYNYLLEGRITKIYDGSGLIQRCPKCDRWIIDDFCMVHGEVEGKWDLRIKAGFDGEKKHMLIFQRNITERILNLKVEEAKKLGEDEILERIKREISGKMAEIDGVWLSGGNFLVNNIKVL